MFLYIRPYRTIPMHKHTVCQTHQKYTGLQNASFRPLGQNNVLLTGFRPVDQIVFKHDRRYTRGANHFYALFDLRYIHMGVEKPQSGRNLSLCLYAYISPWDDLKL